jgi:type IV pilus assembly protein PilB
MASTIEDILIAAGVQPAQIDSAKAKATAEKISFMYALENMAILSEEKLLAAFAQFYQVQIVKIQEMEIPQNIIQLVPAEIAEKSRLIPIDRAGNNIIVAIANPQNTQASYSIRFKTGYSIKPVLASEKRLTEAIEKYYSSKKNKNQVREFKKNEFDQTLAGSKGSSAAPAQVRFDIGKKGVAGDGPIIKLVNDILLQCVERRGSDIHIEPYETAFRIRLRVDGGLEEIFRPPVEIKDALTSRIKIMAGMDIAEKRLPQDGGIRVTLNDKPIDYRVNTLPTIFGEKIVMRLLDKSALQVDMTSLGFEQADLERFMQAIHEPHGMVLVTGPTGSGKTTTLYSALNELNKVSDNIMTAEDPVEYNLEGINQVQVKADIGLDFSAALKAFLRQDPDIIMVGEIRDLTTAEIAIKAALTGHLVLSTLHTNSAVETIVRIKNMGVESFNIASSLNCIVAQRLAKKVCEKCRIVDDLVTPEVMIELGVHPSYADKVKAYKGKGCDACNFNGTRGRVALHEVLLVTEEIKEAILAGANAIELRRIAMRAGMKTLRQAALTKMVQGVINSQEVVSNTSSDADNSEEEEAAA